MFVIGVSAGVAHIGENLVAVVIDDECGVVVNAVFDEFVVVALQDVIL